MNHDLGVAIVQMGSGPDWAENRAKAVRLIRDAAARGAQLIVLPELWGCYGPLAKAVEQAESIPGPTADLFADLAVLLGVVLCAGSLPERCRSNGKAWNTSIVFNALGAEIAKYRKRHLFDANLPPAGDRSGAQRLRESDSMLAGGDICTFSALDTTFGLAICYDLRFPELFREHSKRGAEVLLLPAAFTHTTGRDHWHVLLRARAIENQCFVVAANQGGEHPGGLRSYGHSLIIDPWGEILAELPGEEEGVIAATLSAQRLAEVRSRLPALKHRRD